MHKHLGRIAGLAAIATLALAPAALASGGTNSGGTNDTGSTLSAGPCIKLANVTDPTGYYLSWAAIWHNYTVKNCSSVDQTVNLTVSDVNSGSGQTDFSETFTYYIPAGGKIQGVVDNDFAPFSVNYNAVTAVSDQHDRRPDGKPDDQRHHPRRQIAPRSRPRAPARGPRGYFSLKRTTGLEPATFGLGSRRSTN